MTKVYSLAQTDVADEQKTITITETKSVTSEERITVAQLKERHAQKLVQIESLKAEADALVDQLTEIDTNEEIDLEVTEIPVKLVALIK